MGRNWLLPGALRHSGDGQAGGDSVPPCTNHGTLINSGAAHASFPDLKCSRAQAVKLLSHWCVVELKTPHSWEILLPAPQFLPWEPVTCFEEAFSTLRHAQKQGITFFFNFFFFYLKIPLISFIYSQTSPRKGWPRRGLWALLQFPVPCAAPGCPRHTGKEYLTHFEQMEPLLEQK